ncbi:MAG: hypothetical protein QOG20_5209 [Pseudonocardiales bacterium]|nr:hypothetical protein [Pseudonocardiales bacterium]
MTSDDVRLAARPDAADDNPLVRTLMTHRLLGIVPEAPVPVALQLMADNAVRHLPVMNSGRCTALVAETDLARGSVPPGLTVADVCRPVPAVHPGDRRSTAAQVMMAAGVDAVMVVDGDRLLGMVTATDLVRSLAADAVPGPGPS